MVAPRIEIPDALLQFIFTLVLAPAALARCSLVCKDWHRISSSVALWRRTYSAMPCLTLRAVSCVMAGCERRIPNRFIPCSIFWSDLFMVRSHPMLSSFAVISRASKKNRNYFFFISRLFVTRLFVTRHGRH